MPGGFSALMLPLFVCVCVCVDQADGWVGVNC